MKFRRWYGINWFVHPSLTGVGTNAEKCYIWHRDAIGHAVNKDIRVVVDENKEHDYQYVRTSIYTGSKLLQGTGVVQVMHDGSAHVGA